MNWKRIVVFVALRLIPITLITVAVRVYFKQEGRQGAPVWLIPASLIVNIVVSIGVFALLAYLQRERTFAHVALVILLSWLLEYPLNVMYARMVPLVWAIGLLFVMIYAAIGAGLGIVLRRNDSFEEANPDFPPSI
ncbi:MAG: hypothetical protein H0V88_12025 [Pyrinomonadaceae bacterium]|nr:hypothetical protein [Pyrinomonadaceae bacterium]